MKRLLLMISLALCGMNIYAQDVVASCDDYVFVDTAYVAALTEGEYWFTANTPALPLTIYIYPEDTTAQVADIWLDLTCTPGVYDDPKVASMVSMGSKYGLTFPMLEKPEKHYDGDGNIYYSISFDTNYRDMLYEQGVTYPIPAYVHVKLYTNSSLEIESTSINTQCRKYVNTWGMNTSLRLAPADSTNVYVWSIGDWIDKKYKITWESEGNLTMYDGKSCLVNRGMYVRQQYSLPKDEIIMDATRTSNWINDIYQTDLYTRLYPEADGILRIMEVVEKSEITKYVVAGVNAIIDNEALTISATLPAGTIRNTAIRDAEVTYTAYNGETISYGRGYNTLQFGTVKYDLKGIVVAPTPGNTDATLQSIEVDGNPIEGFSPSIPTYNDVETDSVVPVITATAAAETSTVSIAQADTVPGSVTITVTAEAGNTQVYTVNLIKARSRNTNLREIRVDGRPLPDFTPEERYYRMEVLTLPVVTAIAEDTLSAVQIVQPTQVPGYATISVTSEAGTVDSYSINFSAAASINECLQTMDSIAIDVPVALTVGETTILRFPVAQWTDEYLQFRWEGDSSVWVDLSPICDFNDDFYTIDSLLLTMPKGQEHYEYNLRPEDFTRLANLSVNGNLYIRFRTTEAGDISLTRWTETCITRSVLIEPNQTIAVGGNTHTTVYKLYVDDFMDRDIRLTWKSANSTLRAFFAGVCDFKLTANRDVLEPSPYKFEIGEDSVDILNNTWKDWSDYQDEGFIYARFENKYAGELTFKIVADYRPENPTDVDNVWSSLADNIRLIASQGSLTIRSFATQTVGVYTIDGACVATQTIAAGEDAVLALPAGMYIVRGNYSALKAVVR